MRGRGNPSPAASRPARRRAALKTCIYIIHTAIRWVSPCQINQERGDSMSKEDKEAKKEKKPKKEKAPKPKKEKPPKKEKAPKKAKPPKMKKCHACKAEIPKKAKICPHCAAKQKGNPLPLILGLVLVLVLASGVSIFFFHFPFTPPFELPFMQKSITDTVLGQTMELSKKEEAAVVAIFTECGLGEITEAKPLSSDETSDSYNVNDRNTARYMERANRIVVQLDKETKAVQSIACGNNSVYQDGELVAPVTNFYLGTEARDSYLSVCLTAVKSRLELPETAVFPAKSAWKYSMDGDKVTVESTVTVKNTSGIEETRPFMVEFEKGEFVSVSFATAE